VGVGGQRHAPAALPPGKTRYPLCRRLGGPQGRSGRVRKISPAPEFDPRTVQPLASRYTDGAIPAHTLSLCTSVNVTDQVPYPCQERLYIVFYWLYSLIRNGKTKCSRPGGIRGVRRVVCSEFIRGCYSGVYGLFVEETK